MPNEPTSDGTDIGAFEAEVPCVLICPPDISVPNDPDECGANVTYTPPSGESCGTVTCDHPSGSFFPVGETTVTCTSTAGPSYNFKVTVTDEQAPVITTTNQTMWSPDHTYTTFNVSDLVTSVSDNCDADVGISSAVIVKVTSDEPDDANADGSTINDIVIANNCKSVQLRAERKGDGNGRVYTVTLRVTDSDGNVSTATAKVTVPHAQNGNPAVDSGFFLIRVRSPCKSVANKIRRFIATIHRRSVILRSIMRNFPFTTIAITILLALNVMGQEPKNPSPSVKNVQVTAPVKEAEVGQEVKLTVVATDESGNVIKEQPSTYFAGPFDIAAADENGNVKLFGTGQVTVGAIVGGKPGFSTFMVKAPSIKTIEIHSLKKPLVVGGTMPLDAVTRIYNGDPRTGVPVNWTSDNPQVATVDAGGVVTGVGPGKATITATSGTANATTTVSVTKSNLRSMTITAGTKSARTGDVVRITAQGDPAGDFSTRWSVSGNGATIDSDGSFLAEQPGTYIVTGTSGNLSASTGIVVTPRNLERDLELVGRAPMKEFQGAEQWVIGNYLYYSTIADRFFVYDISDPANPKLTDTIKVDARIVNDISTTADGKILVISREGASNRKNGIAFYDTSDPAHPKLISEYTDTVTGGVHSAFVDKHYVYLTDDATGSLRVIDFADVKKPKEVARWQTEGPYVSTIRTKEGDQVAGRYIHDVYVKDGLAYLAYWHDGLVILDVGAGMKGGSPERPQVVSQLRFNHNELYGDGWLAGTHSVYRYRNYVFIGDEVFPAIFDLKSPKRTPIRGIVHVVDVADINRPRKVAEYPVPEGGAHNMWVENDVMYIGYYGGGGRVVDVSGELRGDLYRQGREIARIWTGDPNGFHPNLPLTWGAQPHNGLIYFNDIYSGIWIMKLGDKIDKGSTTAPGR